MALNSLKDVYLDQMQDCYSALSQSLQATTDLGRAAKDKDLSEALIAGSNGISQGMDKIASLCSDHGIDPNGEKCKGMEGLVNLPTLKITSQNQFFLRPGCKTHLEFYRLRI